MRKIIQILYDEAASKQRPSFLVLCDDGTVWRQVWFQQNPAAWSETYTGPKIVDPIYRYAWQLASEFDLPRGDHV